MPLRRYRIPEGRGTRKGTRAPNWGQFTPISGAEALSAPPLSLRLLKTVENVQLQSRRLSHKLGSVPLRRHRILGGRDMGKWTGFTSGPIYTDC